MYNQRHYIIVDKKQTSILGDVYGSKERAEEVLQAQVITGGGRNPRGWHVEKRGDTVPQAAL